MELLLIPQVKHLTIQNGFLKNRKLCIPDVKPDERLSRALQRLPLDASGTPLSIFLTGEAGESYSLSIREREIIIQAGSAAGAFYAIQTLRQIYREERIPCLEISDGPDFLHRGFYHDVSRGRIPTVQTIRKLIDDMAYYKLNSLQLYVEHVFPFHETQSLIESSGCLTPEELREIGEYCHENFIDFIPSLSTFGHMYEILEQPEYRHLRVLRDYPGEANFWHARMAHHTIDPLQGESLPLVQSLIDQYMPHFDSQWFNICCDETFDLKRYREAGMDEGEIYVSFVNQIISHVVKRGKKVMMWADILLEHPEVIPDLSEETLFLNWYYLPDPEKIEEKVSQFAQSGKKQIVCPGTWSWNRFCEHVEDEEINITGMIEAGWRHGAVGVLNTNWGDCGNPCSLKLGLYGMVLGAAKSWSVKEKPDEAFYDRVNALLYGSDKGMKALKTLCSLHEPIKWQSIADHYYCGKASKYTLPTRETVEAVQREYQNFVREISSEKWEHDEYRKEMLLAAGGICALAQLAAEMAGYRVAPVLDTESWLTEYRKQWLESSKESELANIEAMFLSV